jgi:hypothetical protein
MGRPKKVKPLVKVGVARAVDLSLLDLFALQVGLHWQKLTPEARQRLLSIWPRVQGEFLPRPDRLAGNSHQDPYRFRPGNRPWIWWVERRLEKPGSDGEELLALKKLGVLVDGEWDAALANLRDWALNRWINVAARKGREQETAEQLGVSVALIRKWWSSDKSTGKGEVEIDA